MTESTDNSQLTIHDSQLTSHFSPKKKVKEEKISFDPLHILYILNSILKSQPPDSYYSRLTTHDSRFTIHDSQLTTHDSQPTIHDSQLTIHIFIFNNPNKYSPYPDFFKGSANSLNCASVIKPCLQAISSMQPTFNP
ncbi:hypothetical protein BC624_1101 [Flavobacterium granuli]|uniref:Uncharacterized protein n=1 Tax=Flavobacterium granuli TaxID=280093 RepID=A0A1M5SH93_9FLAO|nr:hypothetical protein BC624_1101 [Flavobacterium granuli]SHH37861.1 hypothetical protein SAMN05443373_1121 [Flavobacterium granuli]